MSSLTPDRDTPGRARATDWCMRQGFPSGETRGLPSEESRLAKIPKKAYERLTIYPIGYIMPSMNSIVFGQELARRRREAGLTQQQVAERMGTTQEAISRIEAGRRLPNVSVVDRYAKAIGRSFALVFGESRSASSQERRRRVERALGKDAFNPWDRNPAPPEVESLLADGLTRERFDSERTAGASQR